MYELLARMCSTIKRWIVISSKLLLQQQLERLAEKERERERLPIPATAQLTTPSIPHRITKPPDLLPNFNSNKEKNQ